MDNFSVRPKSQAASVSSNIVAYLKLVCIETETFCAETETFCIPKHENFAPKQQQVDFRGFLKRYFFKMCRNGM